MLFNTVSELSQKLTKVAEAGTNAARDASRDSRHATRVLLVLTGVSLLVNYVETMVIPGVPTIQKDLSTTATIASWITSAYLIVGSAVSPLFGKLGDIYGKKKMFLISLIFYMAGVGIAGFSPSIYFLLFARALQGVGFAIIPLSLAIISDVFPREKVGMAQGIISGTFAIGAAAGLVIGSYVVQDLGWQYAFHTALILSFVLFFAVSRVLRKDVPGTKTRVDYLGAAILMAGVTLILVYLTEGPTLGWVSLEEIAMLAPGVVLTIFFFIFESKRSDPLIHLGLLRIRNVLVANLVGLISGIVMFLLFFAVVYYTELPSTFGLNLNVIAAGLTLAPSTLGMIVMGPSIGKAMAKFGPRPMLVLGSVLQIAGLLLFIVNRTTRTDVAIDLVLSLAGIVATIVPIVNMITTSLPRQNVAVGLGMNTMLRNLGGAIGPVLATSIMASYSRPFVVQGVHIAQFPTGTAFDIIFGIGIGLTVLVIAISLATKNYTFGKGGQQAASNPPH
ncbi:MAG: MFS transporter [Rhabdochlamydiaceae bacterium]